MMMAEANSKIKHVLGLSGGKDSAALAVHMAENYPQLEIDYFFTDTGSELPEVQTYLSYLETKLNDKKILRLNPKKKFKWWLHKYKHFLPSPNTRWCTKQLKIAPFEEWIKPFIDDGYTVYSYVAIRSDEHYREGYNSKSDKLIVKLPFKDDGIDKKGVYQILERAGLGLPEYYEWRSRSGCTFCFFQQKIEWVGLLERHPEAFQAAKDLEKTSLSHGSPFTWCDGESLEQLERPERIEQIKFDHQKRLERAKKKLRPNPLRPDADPIDIDDLYGPQKMCLNCHK